MTNILIHPMVIEMGAIRYLEHRTGLQAAVDVRGRLVLARPNVTALHGEFCGAGECFNGPKGAA